MECAVLLRIDNGACAQAGEPACLRTIARIASESAKMGHPEMGEFWKNPALPSWYIAPVKRF
jgi:hypothetical protein